MNIVEFPFLQIRDDLISLLEKKGFKHFQGFTFDMWKFTYVHFYKELWFDFAETKVRLEYKHFYKGGVNV